MRISDSSITTRGSSFALCCILHISLLLILFEGHGAIRRSSRMSARHSGQRHGLRRFAHDAQRHECPHGSMQVSMGLAKHTQHSESLSTDAASPSPVCHVRTTGHKCHCPRPAASMCQRPFNPPPSTTPPRESRRAGAPRYSTACPQFSSRLTRPAAFCVPRWYCFVKATRPDEPQKRP